ncbi:hypothetical protein ACT43X_18725 (plasmid) [Acinetobacter baumannii]
MNQEEKIIVLNEIDQKNYEYLIQLVDESAIRYAIAELTAKNKRPYLSNIFKILDIPPRH